MAKFYEGGCKGITELVGFRISTPITSFNAETAEGVTKSGRIYKLVGNPGFDADADWVWSNVARAQGFTTKDVTEEYVALLQQACDI
ncbi:hypothetical protein [Geobacter grbiciae]|uniref:hypothetical protein n=1 Tax=Geobacter grbiciae TaxID=155042 RepID=UPI001C01B065|nr:hypothetical protein [Geobacter grbiciae]MBT1076558.1 hypothetical protein [Geobacter grbiciae]